MLDVLVVGAGPAGRAVAAACGEQGLRTQLLDPAPSRPWRATYGAWRDQLPSTLPASLIATTARAYAVARTRHDLGRDYAILDVPALRAHLDQRLSAVGVQVLRGRYGRDSPRAALVIDAGGPIQPLSRRRPRGVHAQQTAFGVVLPSELAQPILAHGEALFMDWRAIPGESGDVATFLYAIPLDADRVLLEETSLARRPGAPIELLSRRLFARLAGHRIRCPDRARREVVRFPLDLPRHRARGTIGFGSAAPFTHPATGYQLATALQMAQPVASKVSALLSDRPHRVAGAVNAVLWPMSARLTHMVRRRGLECMLRLPPARLPDFFEGFFRLPISTQRDYLDGRTDPVHTALAMVRLFETTDWPIRLRLIGSSLLVSAPPS